MGEVNQQDTLMAQMINAMLLAGLAARQRLRRMSDRVEHMRSKGRGIPFGGVVTDKKGIKNLAYLAWKGLI